MSNNTKNNINQVMPSLQITYRSPLDHLLSGAITSGVISGGYNYNKVKAGSVDKNSAIKDTLKIALQGGIASGSAIASVNYMGNRNYLGAAFSMAFGIGSVIAIEKISSIKIRETKANKITDK